MCTCVRTSAAALRPPLQESRKCTRSAPASSLSCPWKTRRACNSLENPGIETCPLWTYERRPNTSGSDNDQRPVIRQSSHSLWTTRAGSYFDGGVSPGWKRSPKLFCSGFLVALILAASSSANIFPTKSVQAFRAWLSGAVSLFWRSSSLITNIISLSEAGPEDGISFIEVTVGRISTAAQFQVWDKHLHPAICTPLTIPLHWRWSREDVNGVQF